MVYADWVIGVIMAIGASVCAALGDNLIKYSFNKHQQKEAAGDAPVPVHLRPALIVGNFLLIVLNTALNLASFAFVDASISIPFGGLHIVLNLPLARYINNEASSLRAIVCNLVIILGVMVTLVCGNHVSRTFSVPELIANLAAPAFLIASFVLVGGMVVSMTVLRKHPKHSKQRLGITIFTGLIGSSTQVFAKSMSEAIRNGAWENPYTYVCILITIFLALLQVVFLNKCLDRYAATFVVPVVNAILIVVGSTYAGIYFEEMQRWDFTSQVFVPLGILLTAVGIGLLATEPDPEDGREPATSELSATFYEEADDALLDPDLGSPIQSAEADGGYLTIVSAEEDTAPLVGGGDDSDEGDLVDLAEVAPKLTTV